MTRTICMAAFFAGLAVVVWIAVGYIGTSLLALAITALIAGVYLTGAVELFRFQRETVALDKGLSAVPANLTQLGDWLVTLPPSLQNPVRLRVEGERVGLPGPVLTPYLVGLLVLLGMLGTFLGMVVTLSGAVSALESTSDLQTIRAALSAPVKGLGVAFGTSIAGVAASAVLGLLSALCRRERLEVAQRLDSAIATSLRSFSHRYQQRETFKALQLQTEVLPAVVENLQGLMVQIEQQSRETSERLRGEQERFYGDAKGSYTELTTTVGDAVKQLSGQFVREQTRFYDDARNSHAQLAATVGESVTALREQLAGDQARFYDDARTNQSELAAALRDSATALRAQLVSDQEHFHEAASANYSQLAAEVGQSLQKLNNQLVDEQSRFYRDAQASYTTLADSVGASLKESLVESARAAGATIQPVVEATMSGIARDTTALQERVAEAVTLQLDGIAARFDESVTTVADRWTQALTTHERSSADLTGQLRDSLQGFAETFDQRSAALVAAIREQAVALQAELTSTDKSRQAELAQTLETMATALQQEWQQVGARTLAQQEQLCATLGENTRDLVGAAQAQASNTIAEVTRLMESTAEVPRTAAEVIGELRRELSASIARDNEVLTERSRLMESLTTLLAGLDQTATAQREAIDGLVTASAATLENATDRFEAGIATESERLQEVAAQITGGAVEVASLSEAFTHGVQLFADSNDKLMTTLARIEGALDKSGARSDEQLAYYVAQAREIIDLSIMSQRQIIDELQQRVGELAAGEA